MPRARLAACVLSLAALASWPGGPVSSQSQAPAFTDITREAGIDFVHVNGAAGELLLPEVIGPGGALFDYDNDDDLDLFAVQGGPVRASGSQPPAGPARLYRNDMLPGGRVRFVDVTKRSGLDAVGYGMGAATGDFDNDGWVDLYVTYLGANRLYRNRGDGSFADVTAASGTGDPRWSTSATFVDIDRDGWLDLFVANYVDFHPDMKRGCFSAGSARDYCNPAVYDAAPDALFRNNRDGTFSDVSDRAGIARPAGRGLGVIASDLNGDGWTDLYVANDGDGNRLWINQRGSGTFTDEALLAGVEVSRTGAAQGSMGVDLGDIDGDGDEDLFVTNLDNESNTLYVNVGGGLFEDRTAEHGLFRLGLTGFGARFIDLDSDAWLDLVIVNGAVRHLASQVQRGESYPLKQPKLLFRNDSGRRFVDVTRGAGPIFSALEVSRGLSTGDLDNDGDTDLVVFNNSGPLRVLLNQSAGLHWIGARVIEPRHGRDALQTRVELVRGRASLWRRIQADGSYASAGDPRVLFGLGSDAGPQTIRVHWQGGRAEEFSGLAPDRYWILESGKAPRAR